jgi:hypothetical protein
MMLPNWSKPRRLIICYSCICIIYYIHFADFVWFQEIVGSGTQVEAEILESVLRHMRSNKREAKKTSSLKKWLVMKHKMDGYNASLCHTSWLTSLGCPAGESFSLSLSLTFFKGLFKYSFQVSKD